MKQKDLIIKLTELRDLPAETEVFEFKGSVNDNFPTGDIGKYFSALSNEANLKNVECAWLIFGIEDKTKKPVGTIYRNDTARLHSLKKQIADETTNGISFIEIYKLLLPERVLMFQIPATPRGFPMAWKGHYYARDGESLTHLSLEKIERIRRQTVEEDWSAKICPDATIADLDPKAISRARELFKQRFANDAVSVDSWSDYEFLNKSKVTIKGKITRAAIILLGKTESEHFISPSVAKLRWVLKDSTGSEKDYLIESCPFILAVDKVFEKIRNITYRKENREELFPEEIAQYSPDLIYEALNNCIAHQDYSLKGRINIIEMEDELIFTNYGEFIPGSVENVIKEDAPEERYKNDFLATAMFNFRMIQTRGGGIRMMFKEQTRRHFPLPDYDLSKQKVKVTIIGKVLDTEYAEVLAKDPELTLEEIMMLDKVQKRKKLSLDEVKHLKAKGLIEGIKPNYFISAKLAQKTGQKAEYAKAKGFDKSKYYELIMNCIKLHGYAERKDINELLWNVLPSWMNQKQKYNKINHLLAELREKSKIKNIGSDFKSKWVLSN